MMDIKVLGSGCRNCITLEERTRQALGGLGLTADLANITDPATIVGFGVLTTPGLVVDGEVVVAGRVPSVIQLKELLAR